MDKPYGYWRSRINDGVVGVRREGVVFVEYEKERSVFTVECKFDRKINKIRSNPKRVVKNNTKRYRIIGSGVKDSTIIKKI